MKNTRIFIFLFLSTLYPLLNGQVDIYGYLEPQYSAFYFDSVYCQTNYNKLRVDLKSNEVKNTEFGANIIGLLYFGKTDWNLLDFIPARLKQLIPPDMYPYYTFAFRDTLYIDNAYARINIKNIALTMGKQELSLGTGYFSNPTDVFNAKDALDPTYEQPGHNALRLDLYIGSRTNFMVLYTPIEFDWENSGKLIRAKTGIQRFDFSLSIHECQYTTTDFYTFVQTKERRRIIGADFVGELFGLGVWGEGIYNIMENHDDDWYEFISGTDYTWGSGLYAMVEYHRNMLGKPDKDEYYFNDWMRYYAGETKTLCQDQIYGLIQYPVTDLISISASGIYSISDQSAAIIPTVYYSIFENVDLTLMFNIYLGEEGRLFNSSLGNGGYLRAQVYF
jgi:hypothetical protein